MVQVTREPGFYWVRQPEGWVVARWDEAPGERRPKMCWWFPGWEVPVYEVWEVDERQLVRTPKGE